ncbi:MAG: Gfo/Idh/MocA family oxidoreductase [Clostridia bacterium]|nr:Gfo/Idh/MocA family oxidoreductase [Clostridia bacterium]
MKKLNVAIIGQGRSGKDIHGWYFLGENNKYFQVKYVVEADEYRRGVAEKTYEGCKTFADYRELFNVNDIDVVVNASYSEMHYPITKDLLLHGKNVLVEKPFGRSLYECEELMKIAREKGVVLSVFQQSFYAPFYQFALETIKSGKIGEVKQINLHYSGFSRRYDWQTLQKKCAGGVYNTGPHPIGLGLGFLDFDKNVEVVFSRLANAISTGDADDYAKIIFTAPQKPVVDVEISSIDEYATYLLKIQGTRGTLKSTLTEYEMTYVKEEELPDQPVSETFIQDENGNPMYCLNKLIKHKESGKFDGTAFDVGTITFYEQLYYKILEGKEMSVTPQMAAAVIAIAEKVHADNPLPLIY